ncbi:MAG: hypothetical protein IJT27_04965 [Clostridia bacterium]|nr:hypothetical protein [Clostridia bacterium]
MEKKITFSKLPANVGELTSMPEFRLDDPFVTAALTVAVLCNYEKDPSATAQMLNVLKGPRPLSPFEIQFLRDRLADKGYKPFSFFAGSSPANNYTPSLPYTVAVSDNPYSYQNEGYAKLYLQSAGADSPRAVDLRKKGDGSWLLWEQFLLSDIRMPVKDDPWA